MSSVVLAKAADMSREIVRPDRGKPLSARSDEELAAIMAAAGVKLDRTRLAGLAQSRVSVEETLMEDLFDEFDAEDDDIGREALRQLWRRWVPARPCGEDVADAARCLEDAFPEPGSAEGLDAAEEDPDFWIDVCRALVDWVAAGPDSPDKRLDAAADLGADIELVIELALSSLFEVRPDESVALSRRFAELSGGAGDWTSHANILASTGRVAESEKVFLEKALPLEPWNPVVLRCIGDMFAGIDVGEVRDAAKARGYLDRAEALAAERLEKVRRGEKIETGHDWSEEEAEEFDADDKGDETDELAVVESIYDSQAMLADLTEDVPRMSKYLKLRDAVREELGMDEDGEEESEDWEEEEEDDEAGDGKDFVPDQPVQQIVNPGPNIGRNEPCPCGSGKKYKKCCGK